MYGHRRPAATGRTCSGSGATDRHRPARRADGLLPTPAWRNQLYQEGAHRPALVGGRQRPARRRPGRPAGQPAADGDRLRDDRQRRHRASRPHVGMQVEDAAGRVVQEIRPRRRAAQVQIDPEYRDGDPRRPARRGPVARAAPPTASSAASRSRSRARPAPRSARPTRTSPGTSCSPPIPNPEIVVAVTIERGRLRRRHRPRRPRCRSSRELLRQAHAEPVGADGGESSRLMYATRARRARPGALRRPARHRRAPRPALHGRPLCLLRALALVAFSIFTLGQATLHDVPGSPYYFVDRQAIYAVPRHRRHVRCSTRIDYSRFRELRVGIYTFLCVSVSLVFVFGFAARGSRRSFDLPFFSFQPSELGKLLLVLALAGFVIDGARSGLGRQRTVRYLCLGLAPAALVFLQPDLGTSLVYGAITLAVMYVGGVRWTHFAVIGAALVAMVSGRPRGRARGRDAGAQGLPGGEAHVVPASQRGPQRRGLPAESGQDRHRLRGEDRPRRSGHPERGSTSSPSGTPTSSSR